MKVVIIHGNGGATRESEWLPWLEAKLDELGIEVVNQTMPDKIKARAEIWLPHMEKVLGVDESTVVVGHSSGAVAAMRFAQTHKIKGSVLIGACYTDLGEESEKRSGYYDKPWDWKAIKDNQEFIIIFGSLNDPFIDVAEPRHIQNNLKGEYHEYPDKGHFMREHMGGRADFPELLQILLNHLKNQ